MTDTNALRALTQEKGHPDELKFEEHRATTRKIENELISDRTQRWMERRTPRA